MTRKTMALFFLAAMLIAPFAATQYGYRNGYGGSRVGQRTYGGHRTYRHTPRYGHRYKSPRGFRHHHRRARIERQVRGYHRSVGRSTRFTSRYRSGSAAHRRGAVDYSSRHWSSRTRHRDARGVSRRLRGHTVVVEEVYRPSSGVGPSGQRNTAYRHGYRGTTKWGSVKASATHTHVQPDKKKRKKKSGKTTGKATRKKNKKGVVAR